MIYIDYYYIYIYIYIYIYPIGSMYGIYILTLGVYWWKLMENVTIHSIHGSYGYDYRCCSHWNLQISFTDSLAPFFSRGRHDSVHRIRWNGKANSSEGTRGARNHGVHTSQSWLDCWCKCKCIYHQYIYIYIYIINISTTTYDFFVPGWLSILISAIL